MNYQVAIIIIWFQFKTYENAPVADNVGEANIITAITTNYKNTIRYVEIHLRARKILRQK